MAPLRARTTAPAIGWPPRSTTRPVQRAAAHHREIDPGGVAGREHDRHQRLVGNAGGVRRGQARQASVIGATDREHAFVADERAIHRRRGPGSGSCRRPPRSWSPRPRGCGTRPRRRRRAPRAERVDHLAGDHDLAVLGRDAVRTGSSRRARGRSRARWRSRRPRSRGLVAEVPSGSVLVEVEPSSAPHPTARRPPPSRRRAGAASARAESHEPLLDTGGDERFRRRWTRTSAGRVGYSGDSDGQAASTSITSAVMLSLPPR